MSKKEDKKALFSMDVESIEAFVEESKHQLFLAQEYLIHYLNQDLINQKLVCLLSDYYTCNYLLLSESELCLEYNEIIEKEQRKELVLSAENIELIQSTALGRWFTMRELAKLGVSTYMN